MLQNGSVQRFRSFLPRFCIQDLPEMFYAADTWLETFPAFAMAF